MYIDIWYQGNKIVAYVEGTHIYKTEMIIKNNNIENYYCSCPSSEGGMNFCKHLAGIVYYLKEMYPYYKTKKAFREEIINVLNKEDKTKFDELISSNRKDN